MRTTLTVADDVLAAVREQARQEGRSIGAVLSDLARQALTGPADPTTGEGRYGFTPFPPRGGTVTNDLIDRLRADESV